tara:strand:+ start:88 stop:222 length:135 start_codon:yes stop_codon:yes gene_type:complete
MVDATVKERASSYSLFSGGGVKVCFANLNRIKFLFFAHLPKAKL